MYFPETATRLVTPIHRAQLTLPGVAFIETDIRVARNVLVQPTIFLPFYDIGFEKRFIKFKQKTEGYDVPYISKGPQPFNLGGVNYPSNIDSGSVGYSLLPEELADKINIRKYPRMLVYDSDERKYDYNYYVPASIPGTDVHFTMIARPNPHIKEVLIEARAILDKYGLSGDQRG